MPTSYSQVSSALKNALKGVKNQKIVLSDEFSNYLQAVQELSGLLNDRSKRNTINEDDRIKLYDALIELIDCYQFNYTHKGTEIARGEDFKLYQEYTKNVQEKIDVILNKTKEENSKQEDVNMLFGGTMKKVKEAAEGFMFELRRSASQPQIDRYFQETLGFVSEADELKDSGALSEDTNKLMHGVVVGASTIINNPLLTPETKEELARAFRNYTRSYKEHLFIENQRKAILDSKVVEEMTASANNLGAIIDEAVKQLASSNNSIVNDDIAILNKLKDDIQKDTKSLNDDLAVNTKEAKKEELDFIGKREEKKFREAEDKDAFKKGYIEKGERETSNQIALRKIKEDQSSLLAQTPYIDAIYELLGIDENSLPENDVTYVTHGADNKEVTHTRNLRKELHELQSLAMNMALVTAKYYVKSEGMDEKTEYLNLNQLKELNEAYDNFYRATVRFQSAALRSKTLNKESDIYKKVQNVHSPSLAIGASIQEAVNYIEKYALKGEREKHKLFSMYEMMGHPNPDLDGNFTAQVKNVLDMKSKIIDNINSVKNPNAEKAAKKEGKVLKEYVEEKINNIDSTLMNLTENILPQTFINDGTVDIERNRDNILPFVVGKDIKQLTAAYREAFLAMNEFMIVSNKRMETNKKVEGRKHMEDSEYQFYEALLPVYEKVKNRYLLLTYLDKPEPEKGKEKKADAQKKGADAKNGQELSVEEQAQIETQRIVDELGHELDAYNDQIQKIKEKAREEAEKEAAKEIKAEEKEFKRLQKENKKNKKPIQHRDFSKELAERVAKKYKEKVAQRVEKNKKGEQIREFYDYVLTCKEMYRTNQLLPQFLLDDHKQPRISTILSMHQKKKDIDYAIEFEEKLTKQPWKDGKRDFSEITKDFRKHRMQLGTDDKIIQFNTKDDYKQFERVTHDTIKGFFPPTEEKISYNGLLRVVNKKTNKAVGYGEGDLPAALKATIGDTIEVKGGVKIDVTRKITDYMFKHSVTEGAPKFSEDFKDIFTKEELKHKEVQEYVKKLNETFLFEPDGKRTLEYGKINVNKKEVSVEELSDKLINYANKFCKPDKSGKIHITEYDNEKGFDGFFEENGFTKEDLEDSILGDFATAIKRNLKNAGFCKEAKMRNDIPSGYNEGIAKDLVYKLAPGVYPKVTVYDDITLPFYMGQAQPDQLSHVKVARVDNNFNRVLNYKMKDRYYKEVKNKETGKTEKVPVPVVYDKDGKLLTDLKDVKKEQYAEGPMVHTTVKDFRKSAFVGDLPNRNKLANPKNFEGKSDAEIDEMISQGLDQSDNSASPRTNNVRSFKSFDDPSVLQTAADIQVMDYLLGIPKRGVDDLRIDFSTNVVNGKIEPSVEGISAADNGKLPFTAKDDKELIDPMEMRIITQSMADRVERWAQGKLAPDEAEKFNQLPKVCYDKFVQHAKILDEVIRKSKNVQWSDPPINPETNEIIPYSIYDVHKGHIRILNEDQLYKMSMDDLAAARNEAKTNEERENCEPKNIFDTLAKMPKACNEALIDKALHHLDISNTSEEYGSYSRGTETFLGKNSDDKTRDVLTRRFNKLETERLFNKIHRLNPEFWIMDKDRSNEYLGHKILGSSREYVEVRSSVYELNKLIHDEVQFAKKEEMYDAGNQSKLKPNEIAEIKQRKIERQELRNKLAAEKGNDKVLRNVPAKEDPLIYYKVQQKAVDTIKKIEDYLDKDKTVSSRFGKQRRETMVSIYNKLNKQLDEYAQLTGDTSYAPKQITLDKKTYAVTYSNMYENRHDFEMSLPISVNREYQENTIERRKRDEEIRDPQKGAAAQLKQMRKAYEKDIKDKIDEVESRPEKYVENGIEKESDRSLYANVKHDPNAKGEDKVMYAEIPINGGAETRKVPVVNDSLKNAKYYIDEMNKNIDTTGKTNEQINAEKKANELHFGNEFTVLDAAAKRQLAQDEAEAYNNDPKNKGKEKKVVRKTDSDLYNNIDIITGEEARKMTSKYADPNTKKGRNEPNPTFVSKKRVEKAAKKASQIKEAEKKRKQEEYEKAFDPKKKVKKAPGRN
ncbi:hypothetical protein SAMN02910353_01303 [Ruminococcus sp. YRD2003]|nr:hypothetical protein SAMN02910353_01303 [Ruminococcus flavefaciens]